MIVPSPAQHSSQQCHPNIHPILRLAEISSPRIRVHLRTKNKKNKKWIKRDCKQNFVCSIVASNICLETPTENLILTWRFKLRIANLISLTLGRGCMTTIFLLAPVMICGVRMNCPKHCQKEYILYKNSMMFKKLKDAMIFSADSPTAL